jgi:hypothetical protein
MGVDGMFSKTHQVSVKGLMKSFPAEEIDGQLVVIKGSFLRLAEVFDDYWVPAATLPDPKKVVALLKQRPKAADAYTFAQRIPDVEPRYEFPMTWDNVAVINVTSYEKWFKEQTSAAARRNIRKSERMGVMVKSVPYDEDYVRGIMSIYNESPFRGGRRFWHYGKSFETVEAENGTYRDRATFLAAHIDTEMVGYLKIVWDTHSAAIMQILSKLSSRDARTNNALLAEAVRLCEERGIRKLQYESFVYGGRTGSSLTRFKRENGFVQVDVPRFYVPLTLKGKVLIKLGLHQKSIKNLVPGRLRDALIQLREKWYKKRLSTQSTEAS